MKQLLKITVLSFLAVALMGSFAFAQGMKDMRINEVLLKNTDSYQDSYGHRSSWFELHNTGYSNVNIGGSYLKVIRGRDTITYKIPTKDPNTSIAPQGYTIFFADGKGSKGTFYTNFTLEGKGKLELYDASGRELIDAIDFDFDNAAENISMGWFNGDPNTPADWMMNLPQTTPNSTNDTIEFKPRSELFREQDPNGIVMALTAMSVVFIALVLLFQVFKQVGKLMIRQAAKKKEAALAETAVATKTTTVLDGEIPAEVLAAIGVAIRQYEDERHDLESTVITINRVARSYSPWSSKIYGINNQPNRSR